jgi:hypothetical protein
MKDSVGPGLIPTKYEWKKCKHSISGRREVLVPASGANATRSGGTKSMLLMFSTQE